MINFLFMVMEEVHKFISEIYFRTAKEMFGVDDRNDMGQTNGLEWDQ